MGKIDEAQTSKSSFSFRQAGLKMPAENSMLLLCSPQFCTIDAWRRFFVTLLYKLAIKLLINFIVLQFKMNDTLVLSSPLQKENGECPTPVHAIVYSL